MCVVRHSLVNVGRSRLHWGFLALILIVCLFVPRVSIKGSSQPVRARYGMVVSQNGIASRTGAEILRQGGKAVDAAVATAFALAVTHPTAGNIGGGGYLVFRPATGES